MTSDTHAVLTDLASVVQNLSFPLALPQSADAVDDRDDIVDQLQDYVLPRYESLDAPLLTVIGGSTGSGKSAIANALVRDHLAASTAIRPTTRRPLLIVHPDDERWFDSDRILPGLARVKADTPTEGSAHSELELRRSDKLPQGLAILDSPDIDSVVEENRKLAAQLLAAADLWVFVTTAARYADAIPWAMLDDAAERDIVVAVVLNRVPAGVGADIRADLSRRLAERGLEHAPLFVMAETAMDDEGFIPEHDVDALRDWLAALARDSRARSAVARQTLRGALTSIQTKSQRLIPALAEQRQGLVTLAEQVDDSFAGAHAKIMESVADGSVLRGEVLARWQDLVGTGDFFRQIEAGVGRLRDRITSWFKGTPAESAESVEEAFEDGIADLLVTHSQSAIASVERSWARGLGGEELVARAHQNLRTPDERTQAAVSVVREWQAELLELIRETGESKRATARILAMGVNTLGVALMVIIFATTAGLTGGEVAVAGGTAVVAQKLLEAVFGDEAVRQMTKSAKESLSRRAGEFLLDDSEPFRRELSALHIDPSSGAEVEEILSLLQGALDAEEGR